MPAASHRSDLQVCSIVAGQAGCASCIYHKVTPQGSDLRLCAVWAGQGGGS